MASYDPKAILGEKLKRLTDKTLKAIVDCMCAAGAALCSLDKRVSALESVEPPEGGYKPMQEPVASPSADGTAVQFIESVAQDATGRIIATKKSVTVDSTYSAIGTNPVNGTAVAAALATSLTDVDYAANASGGGGNLNKTKNGSTTSVLAFMTTAEAHSLWTNAKANAS